MPWTYRKSKKIGPLRVSVSKRGLGASIGKGGMRIGKRAGGRRYVSAGKRGVRNTQSCLVSLPMVLFLGCLAAAVFGLRRRPVA